MKEKLSKRDEALWIAIRYLREHKDPLDELLLAALFQAPVEAFRKERQQHEAEWGLFDPLPPDLTPELLAREKHMERLLAENRYMSHVFLGRRIPVADILLAEKAMREIGKETPFYLTIARNNLLRLFKVKDVQYDGLIRSLITKGITPSEGWLDSFAKLNENRYMDILNDISLTEFIQCPTRVGLTITEKDALFLGEVKANQEISDRYMKSLWDRLGIRTEWEYISLEEEAAVRPTMRFLTFDERHLLTMARFDEFEEWIGPVMKRVDRAKGYSPIKDLAGLMGRNLHEESLSRLPKEELPILGVEAIPLPPLPVSVREAIHQMEACFGRPWNEMDSLRGLSPKEAQLLYVRKLSSRQNLLSLMGLSAKRCFLRKMYYGVPGESRRWIDDRYPRGQQKRREEGTEAFLREVAHYPVGDPVRERVLYLYERFLQERGVRCLLDRDELSQQLFREVIHPRQFRL